MVAYLKRIPAGIAGDVSRVEHMTIEPQQYDAAFASPVSFSVPMCVSVNGKMRQVVTGDTAAQVYGLLVRAFPGGTGVYAAPLGVQAPGGVFAGGPCNILKRGYMTIVNAYGTPAPWKGAPVYWRITVNGANNRPVSQYEAVADGAYSLLIPNAYFMGPPDSAGNTEIGFNI